MSWRRPVLVVTAAVVMAAVVAPVWAWARSTASGAETNTFATHVFLAPGQPVCSGLGIVTVTLTWSAPSDSAQVLGYELGVSTTSGGPYTYSNVGTGTSTNTGVSSGNNFFVVRSVNHLWRGPNSAERKVVSLLGLTASCP
ncbi:MAG TPA: hypothetical protein VHT75_19280 [Acidimicrobiales bacterium]|jgi:hypothetical protein|nr:hypothetical protein [Acidimicrobiales bacterium]